MDKPRLILPPCDFADDQDLLAWLEAIRLIGIKAADEIDEAAAYLDAKLRRYAESEGMDRGAARREARRVSVPLGRGATALERFAGYARLTSRRTETFVEATARPRRRPGSDFTVRGRAS